MKNLVVGVGLIVLGKNKSNELGFYFDVTTDIKKVGGRAMKNSIEKVKPIIYDKLFSDFKNSFESRVEQLAFISNFSSGDVSKDCVILGIGRGEENYFAVAFNKLTIEAELEAEKILAEKLGLEKCPVIHTRTIIRNGEVVIENERPNYLRADKL